MADIPNDVMEAAYEAMKDPTGGAVMCIARAIVVERDRCAKAAEEYALHDHPRLSPGSEINAWWSGQEYAYEIVRRKIRRLPLPPAETKSVEAIS